MSKRVYIILSAVVFLVVSFLLLNSFVFAQGVTITPLPSGPTIGDAGEYIWKFSPDHSQLFFEFKTNKITFMNLSEHWSRAELYDPSSTAGLPAVIINNPELYISESAEVGISPQIFIMTEGNAAINMCLRDHDHTDPIAKDFITYPTYFVLDPGGSQTDYNCVKYDTTPSSDPKYLHDKEMNDENFFNKINGMKYNDTTKQRIIDVFNSIKEKDGHPGIIDTRVAPKDANVTACASFLQKPMFPTTPTSDTEKADWAKQAAIVAKKIAEIKGAAFSIEEITSFITNNYDTVVEMDNSSYATYYSELNSAATYPTIFLDQAELQKTLAADIISLNNESTVEGAVKLILDKIYVEANNSFNKCLKSKGDPAARLDDEFFNKAMALANKAIVGASQKCPSTGVLGIFHLGDAILNSFCEISLAINQFANSIFCYAQNKLSEVLGITEIQCLDTSQLDTVPSTIQ